jgi:hypothetical protein
VREGVELRCGSWWQPKAPPCLGTPGRALRALLCTPSLPLELSSLRSLHSLTTWLPSSSLTPHERVCRMWSATRCSRTRWRHATRPAREAWRSAVHSSRSYGPRLLTMTTFACAPLSSARRIRCVLGRVAEAERRNTAMQRVANRNVRDSGLFDRSRGRFATPADCSGTWAACSLPKRFGVGSACRRGNVLCWSVISAQVWFGRLRCHPHTSLTSLLSHITHSPP